MAIEQQIYDDGTVLGWDTNSGLMQSKEVGSDVWVDNPIPLGGWSLYRNDMQEQARMGAAYPANGEKWDVNAAIYGVTRGIDTAVRAYTNIKGSQAATYAGQNGQTYQNGQSMQGRPPGGDLGLLLILGAVFMAFS